MYLNLVVLRTVLLLHLCVATSLSPEHTEAVTLAAEGKLEQARKKLLLLAESTTDARVFNDKGVIDMRLGFELLDSAIASFEKGLKLNPTHTALAQNLKDLNEFLQEEEAVFSTSSAAPPPLTPPLTLPPTTPPPTTPPTTPPPTTPPPAQDLEDDDQDPNQALMKKVFGTWLTNKKIKRYARRAFGLFRPVQIENCFSPAFAMKLHRELSQSKYFKFYEGNSPFYQFRLNAIYDEDDDFQYHSVLQEAREALNSDTVMDWMADVGNADIEWGSMGASLYKPGDHTQAHTDVKDNDDGTRRKVAYIIHLAKNWDPTFGGDLVKMSPTTHILPIFNAITLFPVTLGGWHFVTPVTNKAIFPKYQRLAVSGWFMSEHTEDLDAVEELGSDRDEPHGYWHLNGNTGAKLPQVNQLPTNQLSSLWRSGTRKRKRRRRNAETETEKKESRKKKRRRKRKMRNSVDKTKNTEATPQNNEL